MKIARTTLSSKLLKHEKETTGGDGRHYVRSQSVKSQAIKKCNMIYNMIYYEYQLI